MKKSLLLLALLAASASIFAAKKPNIVYIMTDDHSYQTLAAYGGMLKDIVKTPNMDRIANEGILFERCYVTNSLCGPARATVISGKHSHANGFYANTRNQSFDGSQSTFPKVLQKAGYQTAIVGKWHLHSNPTGFDYWDILPGQGRYYNPEFIGTDGKKYVEKGYNSDVVTDKALKWMDARDKEKPFMIMVHYKGVHCEWEPALRHLNMYDNVEFPIPDTFNDDYSTRGWPAHNTKMRIADNMENYRLRLNGAPNSASNEEKAAWKKAFAKKDKEFFEGNDTKEIDTQRRYQRYMQNYCATLYGVDENIGRILDYLKKNGLDEDTLVVYTSDQGFFMGEHGWYDKRFMYEEVFRTPLVMRWPGKIKAGTRTSAMVQNLDFAQTFIDIAGGKDPGDMQGLSLKPILLNEGKAPSGWRKSLYYRYYEWPGAHSVMRHDGVIMENEKLIDFYPIGEKEYYDLSSDPKELKNKYSDPAVKERVEALQAELERLRKFYKAPSLKDEVYEPEALEKALQKREQTLAGETPKKAPKKKNKKAKAN